MVCNKHSYWGYSYNQLKENINNIEIILKDDILEKIDQTHLKRMNPAP